MKPFQLYPKPLAHLTCKSSPPQRPENGTPLRATGKSQPKLYLSRACVHSVPREGLLFCRRTLCFLLSVLIR